MNARRGNILSSKKIGGLSFFKYKSTICINFAVSKQAHTFIKTIFLFFSYRVQKNISMKIIYTCCFAILAFTIHAQHTIQGVLQDPEGAAVEFANVALYNSADSTMTKVETTDELGIFKFQAIPKGNYFLQATMVGLADLTKTNIEANSNPIVDLGILAFGDSGVDLSEVTVTASRAMVEVKPDRTVFNVEGTINSVGENGVSLLRKAPGVVVDNNNNVSVLGRTGVLFYVDGKRLPLSGDDLSNYLENLPAEQIDRIDIISNPGAKYEAEGNAGIVDIRLKRDKNHGSNGSISTTVSQGRHPRYNVNASGNYRNKLLNTFGTLGYNHIESFNEMRFQSVQNGIYLDEFDDMYNDEDAVNFRFGTDFYLGKKHILGFLVGGRNASSLNTANNSIELSDASNRLQIDSILISDNRAENERTQNTYNINYRYEIKNNQSLNLDLDYGSYGFKSERLQPNRYYDAETNELLTENINTLSTPTQIDIYTAKLDYEQALFGGQLGLGTKLSRVQSDNTFLFFNKIGDDFFQNNFRSNQFDYDENVYAGYVSFARPLNQKWNVSGGLRMEQTDATGNLQAFVPELQEPPVEFNYLSWFPSFGLTYTPKQMHSFAFNYGRRINRPDYNVLNPFNNQLSEISYEKGNPFLQPEIVNNFELGYTWQYRYNFKIAYSKTDDQITRLIAPDDIDPRANFITWANLSEQTVWSFNASLPIQIAKKWNAYFNLGANHTDNQADYGDGAVVDVQAFSYNIYTQHTFDLPSKFKGEISGYFAGPGVWGGVFLYDPSWSLNIGLQRKFLQDKLNVKLSASDLFYESGWQGESSFNGLVSAGSGNWDSRRISLSLSYRFGNDNVKSRKRKTGLEEEGKRVGN